MEPDRVAGMEFERVRDMVSSVSLIMLCFRRGVTAAQATTALR
jgi:hypothetical protein